MNKPSINSGLLGLGALVICALACVKPTSTDNRPVATTTPTATIATSAPPTGVNSAFQIETVCNLPKQSSAGTPYAQLGGGAWSKWIDEGGDLDHSCNGGTDEIKLKKTSDVEVIAEYQVFGSVDRVHYIAVQYTAFQYLATTQDEKAIRKSFAEFCNQLANGMFGKELSKTFTNKLLKETTYYPAGTANEYGEKIGSGYVNLSTNKNKTLMYLLNVKFFPSEGDYQRFKDS
jgi:hypothetical protein